MFHKMRLDGKRVTRIEYFYPDAPDQIMEAECAIGYTWGSEFNNLLDEGILFYFVDEAELVEAHDPENVVADFVVVREVI